jgi:hypothetical protein
MDKWFFVVNSTAGNGKTGKKINDLINLLNEYKYDFEMSTWSHDSWFSHNGFLCQFIDKSLAYEKEF